MPLAQRPGELPVGGVEVCAIIGEVVMIIVVVGKYYKM
jgi:hypothetical protein